MWGIFKNISKSKLLAGVAASVLGVAGVSQTANAATIAIGLQEAGYDGGAGVGAIFTVASSGGPSGVTSFTGTYGDFTVTINGAVSTNDPIESTLLDSTVSVKNSNLLTVGTHTLHIWVTETDYTLPTGTPLGIESALGGSVVFGSAITMTDLFQAYAANSSTAFDTTGFTNGPQNGVQTGNSFDTGSVIGTFGRTSPSSPFTLTSVANLELSGGGTAGYQDHINVVAGGAEGFSPLPSTAYAGMALLVGLGVVAKFGRRGLTVA